MRRSAEREAFDYLAQQIAKLPLKVLVRSPYGERVEKDYATPNSVQPPQPTLSLGRFTD